MNRTTNAEGPPVEETTERRSRKAHRRVCPECGKEQVHRSRRRTLSDYLLSLAGLVPYRCHECDHRFHVRRRQRTPRSRWASCPRCSSNDLQRVAGKKVPHTWGNLPWRLISIPAYRCPGCRNRFFDIRPQQPEEAKRSKA
ncbi:MAG: hypothetical protein A3H28_17330 [Acidobacteria bacterium RIFCSPLOWO2_02_FULL_61_28]|nr:MAG: hypothetical protein A3H28_17330 [Acidobacteria bacterium RIFCSPLOWO2_02_FULL_61_28]